MRLAKQGNTQVYSPFGTYVVEQHDSGSETGDRFRVPEPEAGPPAPAPKDAETKKAA